MANVSQKCETLSLSVAAGSKLAVADMLVASEIIPECYNWKNHVASLQFVQLHEREHTLAAVAAVREVFPNKLWCCTKEVAILAYQTGSNDRQLVLAQSGGHFSSHGCKQRHSGKPGCSFAFFIRLARRPKALFQKMLKYAAKHSSVNTSLKSKTSCKRLLIMTNMLAEVSAVPHSQTLLLG